MEVQKLPRAEHAPDILTHPASERELADGLQRMAPTNCRGDDGSPAGSCECRVRLHTTTVLGRRGELVGGASASGQEYEGAMRVASIVTCPLLSEPLREGDTWERAPHMCFSSAPEAAAAAAGGVCATSLVVPQIHGGVCQTPREKDSSDSSSSHSQLAVCPKITPQELA